jgi:AraC family transcriptional activator of pobA
MKKQENRHLKFDSLSDAHRAFGLPKPLHPLVSLINNMDNQFEIENANRSHILNFYKISYRTKFKGKFKYGQGYYDFDEGGLLFASPNQLIGGGEEDSGDHAGYVLLIHPDFFLSYPLAKKIKHYGFFSYDTNEALHLSDQERTTIVSIFQIIEQELEGRIDDFSQDVTISQIELLLNYSNRFYKRQFITRKAAYSDLLQKVNDVLENYFNNEKFVLQGVPSVLYLAERVNLSPSYLSDTLRSLTGQNAQQHIHTKLIEKAKELLSTTEITVSQVAYTLGFEHPQSFSKLLKSKTKNSPMEFRRSFN